MFQRYIFKFHRNLKKIKILQYLAFQVYVCKSIKHFNNNNLCEIVFVAMQLRSILYKHADRFTTIDVKVNRRKLLILYLFFVSLNNLII
jgi:hypothetical protein